MPSLRVCVGCVHSAEAGYVIIDHCVCIRLMLNRKRFYLEKNTCIVAWNATNLANVVSWLAHTHTDFEQNSMLYLYIDLLEKFT
jgi:hypothetical protein